MDSLDWGKFWVITDVLVEAGYAREVASSNKIKGECGQREIWEGYW